MFWKAGATVLLAAGAHAGGVADLVAEGILTGRSPSSLEQRMQDDAARLIVVERRASSTAQASQNGTMDMEAWDTEVNAACQSALSKLHKASNPSGTCTCYNLPVINNQTGAFEADLRLYQLSDPTGDFDGISAEQIQVSLSYNGASVSPVNTTTAAEKVSSIRRQDTQGKPTLLQTYMFVGQVDADKLQADSNMAALEAVVVPTVTLSAINSAGNTVSTNVSTNEASFLVGVFADVHVLSDTAQAQVAVNQVVAGLANGTVAFVLPGVNLLIFPIGLVITGAWFAIGLVVIGFGFFERVQHREMYRKTAAIAGKGAALKTF
ncbi:hypothetical protein VPNG_06637 [Cytospora leucostoma]|uniref:Uncharacterized protein n=1 Tax=Cytospora leucostoma TaxID=1230097 RepID=A0A423WUE3_9PEZI|nr:hypothetical protein VPNG_06637 [Cytospora leucostoma]